MPSVEWYAPHTLVSPRGSIDFNTPVVPDEPRYLIQPAGYKVVPAALRAASDPLSQTDGSLLHPRYKNGYVATLTVEYHLGDAPACKADATDMDDALLRHIEALTTPTPASVTDQRLLWTPAGKTQRMLDEILLLQWAELSFDGLYAQQALAFESPFPYAVDAPQQVTLLGGSAPGTVVVNNTGSAKTWPVFLVNGAGPSGTSSFTVTNTTTGLAVVYAGTAIASGHYVEVDAFRGTCYLDGSGASRLGSIDPEQTDFFPLEPGPNSITITGASATMLWNVAWA